MHSSHESTGFGKVQHCPKGPALYPARGRTCSGYHRLSDCCLRQTVLKREHLSLLANSFTNKNVASSRMAIDAFLFRSTAMVPSPQRMIVMLENQVSAILPRVSQMDTISGIIDYTAVVAKSSIAEIYCHISSTISQCYSDEVIALPVAYAEALEGNLPRIILQLVACAKHLQKSHIRGAVTTGFKWYFVVVNLDADGDGAKYWVSEPIEWKTTRGLTSMERIAENASEEYDPALIAGILRHGFQTVLRNIVVINGLSRSLENRDDARGYR